jgi:hypothetical protein
VVQVAWIFYESFFLVRGPINALLLVINLLAKVRSDLQREECSMNFSKEVLDPTPHTFNQQFVIIKAVHSFPLLLDRVGL